MAEVRSAFTVDGSVFAMRMQQLKGYVGHDLAKQCLPYEAKQFVRSILRVTPPFFLGGKGSPASRAKLGRKAVERDILRTMRPISYKSFTKNLSLRRRVQKLEEAGDLNGLGVLFDHLKSPVLGRNRGVGAFAENRHTSRRDRRGHVSKKAWPTLMVLEKDRAALSAYVKRVQSRVGWHLAGWRAAVEATGETMPSFASGLSAPSGYIEAMDGEKPSITIRNGANMSPALKDQSRYVMQGREKALASKVSRLIAGKAVNLGFATYLAK